MHTRRFGALLIGMWLMGTVLVWFANYQSALNVNRLFTNPSAPLQKEINDIGADVTRQMFRFQAAQYSRKLQETWEYVQLGLAAALLATALLTPHRSRAIVISTLAMALLVAVMAFYLTPLMNGLSRIYDFLPSTAALRERQNFSMYQTMHRALDTLKVILALGITGRLLFDFYDFGRIRLPWSKPPARRRRTHAGRQSMTTAPDSGPSMPTVGS